MIINRILLIVAIVAIFIFLGLTAFNIKALNIIIDSKEISQEHINGIKRDLWYSAMNGIRFSNDSKIDLLYDYLNLEVEYVPEKYKVKIKKIKG